jgi:hypothetical protein
MNEIEDLKARADRYEQAFIRRDGAGEKLAHLFASGDWFNQASPETFLAWYNTIIKRVSQDLEHIGGGQQCLVYASQHYVLKLRQNVSGCHIDLRNSPDQALLDICGQYTEPCEETHWRNPAAAPYFLVFDYLTPQGLAAIQKRVDCSSEAQD